MARTVALWMFGLFGAGIGGALIVGYFFDDHVALLGLLAGIAAFACGRLWTTENRKSD